MTWRLRLLPLICAAAAVGLFSTAPATSDPVDYSRSATGNAQAMDAADSVHAILGISASVRIDTVGLVISGPPDELPAAVMRAHLQRAAGDVPIHYETVAHSLAELSSWTDALTEHRDTLLDTGVELTSWGPDLETNSVQVTLGTYTPAAERALRQAFPGAPLTVLQESNRPAAASRTADSSPWYAGDLIGIPASGLSCTSWFGTKNSAGTHYSATAAHCGGSVGSSVTQDGNSFGKIAARAFGGSSGLDAQTIDVTGSVLGRIWADPTTTSRTITGLGSADTVGGLICFDGSTSREVCNVQITNVGLNITIGGQTITGVVRARQLDGKKIAQPGDSGGPVTTTSGTTSANARGMIVASYSTTDSTRGYYTPVRKILNHFGLTLITG